jgi:hypothetical protein
MADAGGRNGIEYQGRRIRLGRSLQIRREPCKNVARGELVTEIHIGLIAIRLKRYYV